MHRAPRVASAQEGVFSHADAIAAGWTDSALRHAVRVGNLYRLRTGVYAVPPPAGGGLAMAELTQLAVAAAISNHQVRVSHLAAARLCGWDVWAPRPHACITYESAATAAVRRVHSHRATLWTPDRARRGSVLLTTPARTVVDVAREFGTEAGTVVADAALRSGLLGSRELHAAVARAAGRPGIGDARPLPAFSDAGSESVLESRSRWRMGAAGIPAPALQTEIFDEYGIFLARVDFYWSEFGVVGEADGRGKYVKPEDVYREKRREDLVRGVGLEFVRWGWPDLAPFAPTANRLQAAFGRGERDLHRRRWRTRSARKVV